MVAMLILMTACKKEDPQPKSSTLTPTPLQPVAALGSQYAGGMVVYLEEGGQHGLVICNEDLGQYVWSMQEDDLATGKALGTGKANTELIVNTYPTANYAAHVCYNLTLNGYDDWFLPSDRELFEVLHAGAYHNLQGLYWTSSQANHSHSAFYIKFNPTSLSYTGKDFLLKVRAVRRF